MVCAIFVIYDLGTDLRLASDGNEKRIPTSVLHRAHISVNAVIVNDAVCRTMATLRPAPSTLQRVALVSEGILKVIYMGWPRDRLGGLSL